MLELEEIREIYTEELNKDLNKVSSWIESINENLVDLKNKKESDNNLNLHDRYYKMKCEYYLEKANSFKRDIESCLESKDINIEFLHQSQRFKPLNKHPSIFEGSIYSVNVFPYRLWIYDGSCNPDNSKVWSIRFGELPVSDFDSIIEEILDSYKNRSNDPKYYDLCEAYIDSFSIDLINRKLKENYFLREVHDDIIHFLELYEVKDYRSIAHVLPPLIEGLIHDVCDSLGLVSVKYDKVSFTESIKYLSEKAGKPYTYEYFLFEFPIIRNKIAHGRKSEINFREVALHFILDMSGLIDVLSNKKIPINKVFKIVSSPSLDGIKEIKDIEYNLLPNPVKEEYSKLGRYISDEEFWNALKGDTDTRELDSKNSERLCKFLLSKSNRFEFSEEIKRNSLFFLKETLPNLKIELEVKRKEHEEFLQRLRRSLK